MGQKLHLLVTDVMMPAINGPELATRLRATHPEIKTLFTSGYVETSSDQMNAMGPDAEFLLKPYKPETLATKVREILDS